MVVAGPGTGKTQIISLRIANILRQTDTPPDGILALTFTESGAAEMRERLLAIIGSAAYYVNISTFHAFCSEVIRSHPDKFIIAEEVEPLSDLERVQLFREIIDEGDFKVIKPFNSRYYYVKALIGTIRDLKREGVSEDEYEEIIKKAAFEAEAGKRQNSKTKSKKEVTGRGKAAADREQEKFREVLRVYRAYQKKLSQRGRYDFEDMINLVVAAFKEDEELLRSYQERLLYFLVDEYQDTNTPQNEVLALLASYWGNQANVFVVGDDQQAIYRFQGASLENILFFRRTFPQAKVITLRENYRSQPVILDAAYQLIQNNEVKLADHLPGIKRKLTSQVGFKPTKIKVGEFASGTTENYFVGQKIKKLINAGVNPAEIAVIYRHNTDGAEMAQTLAKLGVTFDIEGGVDVLQSPEIQKFLCLLRVIANSRHRSDDQDLFTLLHYDFLGLAPLDILKLSRLASEEKINLIEAIGRPELDRIVGKNSAVQLREFLDQIAGWQKLAAEETFTTFFERVLNESGFLRFILAAADAVEQLNRFNSLYAEVKKLNSAEHNLKLTTFLENINLLRESNLPIYEEDLNLRRQAVLLTTAHRAKGQEFGCVFLIRAVDRKWGNQRVRELIKMPEGIITNMDLTKKERNEDERRLFYVALTRAKKEVIITYAKTYAGERGRRETIPAMFLTEIGADNRKVLDVAKYEREVKKILTDRLQPVGSSPNFSNEAEFLQTILKNFKLSVTALSTYLTCPYKFKLNNILRTPRAKDRHLVLGSAVHGALESFFRQFKTQNSLPGKKVLLANFERALAREIVSPTEQAELLKQGQKLLSGYYDHYQKEFLRPLYTEKYFGYGFSKVFLGDIPLVGKVDRIDLLSRPDRTVRVVDYKTGKSKTRGEIEGTTKSSPGDYKRQLVFYKLLADLDQRFNFTVTETEIDFVAPPDGRYKKEIFKVADTELADLKKTIQETVKKIRNLNFPRTTEYQHCARCDFQSHCWPQGVPKVRDETAAEASEKGGCNRF